MTLSEQLSKLIEHWFKTGEGEEDIALLVCANKLLIIGAVQELENIIQGKS